MTEHMTAEQYRARPPGAKSKYGNRKTVLDGITFDSMAEARYYSQLKIREKAGEVRDVELQRPFALLGNRGELITTYKCDFAFFDITENRFRVIDVKGFSTPVFNLKRKMMRGMLGIEVEVVK